MSMTGTLPTSRSIAMHEAHHAAALCLAGMVPTCVRIDRPTADLAGLVTIDWGGSLFLTAEGRDERVARQVICPAEAYDNFPPGLPGKVADEFPVTIDRPRWIDSPEVMGLAASVTDRLRAEVRRHGD